ncbi:hypothetical protein RB195_017705 [Necator americanus]|uniref:Uncharacterized protein n=1 Tax=Necator americanus TaxID=51031 RepID=A0ABR1C6G0_NECAM
MVGGVNDTCGCDTLIAKDLILAIKKDDFLEAMLALAADDDSAVPAKILRKNHVKCVSRAIVLGRLIDLEELP